MNLRPLLLLIASLAAVATVATACGGGGSSPKIRSFTATPGIVPSLGGDVTFVWDVTRADEVRLEPGVGVVTGTSATVHVTETTTYTLVAKKDGRSDHKRATVTVAGASAVTGVVRAALSREPVANVVVWIKGHGATYTAADGSFTFDDVETPYDIAVIDQPFGGAVTIVYLGVTRQDPILEVTGIGPGTIPYSANLSGTIVPADPGGVQTRLFFDTNFGVPGPFPGADNWGPVSTNWTTTETYDVTVHGLRYTLDTAGNIATYTGYGSTVVSATSGIAAVANVTLAATTTDVTTGSINVPGNTTIDDAEGFMILGIPTGSFEDKGFFLPLDGSNLVGENEFEIPSPAIPGSFFGARITLQNPDTNDSARAYLALAPGSTENEIDLPAPPRLLLPVDDGLITRDSVFQIAGRDDSLKVYELTASTFPPYEVVVITTENSFTIPDTREIGADLFNFSQFSWGVYAELAPRGTIDEVLGNEGIAGTQPQWFGNSSFRTVHPLTTGSP